MEHLLINILLPPHLMMHQGMTMLHILVAQWDRFRQLKKILRIGLSLQFPIIMVFSLVDTPEMKNPGVIFPVILMTMYITGLRFMAIQTEVIVY